MSHNFLIYVADGKEKRDDFSRGIENMQHAGIFSSQNTIPLGHFGRCNS